jgi:hypothetical protein
MGGTQSSAKPASPSFAGKPETEAPRQIPPEADSVLGRSSSCAIDPEYRNKNDKDREYPGRSVHRAGEKPRNLSRQALERMQSPNVRRKEKQEPGGTQ